MVKWPQVAGAFMTDKSKPKTRAPLPTEGMTAAERKALSRKARCMIRWPAHPFARRYQTAADMEPAIREYFETCASIARPYTTGGLATFMGMTLNNIWYYKTGKRGDTPAERQDFKDLLEMAYQVIETSKEEMGLIGIFNAAFTQFDLKHNHGWSDKQEYDHRSGDGSMTVTRRIIDPQDPDSVGETTEEDG